jgi:hypothetical protein
MKPQPRDGAASRAAWKRLRREKLAHILRTVPKAFSTDLLTLAVCDRYAESLLANPRVRRYLSKYHPKDLMTLEKILAEMYRGLENNS